jgi:hypothetical protein
MIRGGRSTSSAGYPGPALEVLSNAADCTPATDGISRFRGLIEKINKRLEDDFLTSHELESRTLI